MIDSFEVSGLSKTFKRKYALIDVGFKVKKGDVLGVIGKNGAGKTTLFNTISGFFSPDKGLIFINGKEIKSPLKTKEIIGYLSHELFLYNDLTGLENLLLFGGFYKIKNLKNKVEEILTEVNLIDEKDKRVCFYSRGMKQRLAIARVLLIDLPIWLLDEPTTGLDENGRQWLHNLLKNENERIILISSHSREDVEEVCNRIIALKKGRIVYEVEKTQKDWIKKAFESI